jgi:hypothetical protein
METDSSSNTPPFSPLASGDKSKIVLFENIFSSLSFWLVQNPFLIPLNKGGQGVVHKKKDSRQAGMTVIWCRRSSLLGFSSVC